jgi:hypothetical protein
MTELSSPSPADMPSVPDVKLGPLFYVVALRKFALLFVATFGLYQVYWFYKNWSNFKGRMPFASEVGTTIWPVPRAVFSVFFVHALFKAVKQHAPDKPSVAAWGQSAHATLVVVLILLSNVLSRLSEKIDENFWLNMAAILIVFPLMVAIRNAQDMINIACDDPQGRTNATLTWANYTWIAIGTLCWVLILIGTFAMGPDTGGGAGFHTGGDSGF